MGISVVNGTQFNIEKSFTFTFVGEINVKVKLYVSILNCVLFTLFFPSPFFIVNINKPVKLLLS